MKPHLWTYWENRPNVNPPPYIDLCKKTFIKFCSDDFDIHFLDDKNFLDYVSDLPPTFSRVTKLCQKVDILRLFLLYERGGLWVDLDTIILKSLMPLYSPIANKGVDFTFSRFSKLSPGVVLNGFFGANKGSIVLRKCKEEVIKRLDKGVFSHTEFGEQTLTPIVNSLPDVLKEEFPLNWLYQLEDKDNFRVLGQGFHYELLRKNFSPEEVIGPHTLGVSLYNDMYNNSDIIREEFNVVEMSQSQFLDSNVLSARIFKEALCL